MAERSAAHFSPCRTWRYSLERDVAPLAGTGTVAFIGLNPSTADEMRNDPTVRRCIGFAQTWGFARMRMLNLYGFRETNSSLLFAASDPVGPENDQVLAAAIAEAHLVICAWGAWAMNGDPERIARVVGMIEAPHCLGLTAGGAPRHPLYVRSSTWPRPFAHCPDSAAFVKRVVHV